MSAPMNTPTLPVGFIRFHGMTLLVVESDGIEYVRAKALSDLLGMAWRKTRDTIQSGDNAVLYGTTRLTPPNFDDLEDPRVPHEAHLAGAEGGEATENTSQKGDLYLRLDRARMFLARVSTNQMRAQGNQDAAGILLALQIEWAEALHQYETHGVAVKQARREGRREIHDLMKTRGTPPTAAERTALTRMLADSFADQGYPVPNDPQQSLPGV